MVQSLFSCGANSIWEYSLLNPAENESVSSSSLPSKSAEFGKMRKPRASDPLHPQKSDFIRAKHLHQAFVFRPAGKEVVFLSNICVATFKLMLSVTSLF